MYELDKAAFGRFLAQLRREKGMTQKDSSIIKLLSLRFIIAGIV